jgi:RNA polymerase sigma factor (sigma-70 family)
MSPVSSPATAAHGAAASGQPPRLSPAAAARMDRLYREYASRHVGLVASMVHRRRHEVEDCCQFAWAVLARRPDVLDGPSVRGWLVAVAVHQYVAEARRAPLSAERLDRHCGPPLEDILDAREALRMVAALRPVRRRVFERQLAGLSYAEIAAEQGLTYTNVNRQITESRAELRAAA